MDKMVQVALILAVARARPRTKRRTHSGKFSIRVLEYRGKTNFHNFKSKMREESI